MIRLLLVLCLAACRPTYQVMDGKRVPRHPNDTIAAQFPNIPPPDSAKKVHRQP